MAAKHARLDLAKKIGNSFGWLAWRAKGCQLTKDFRCTCCNLFLQYNCVSMHSLSGVYAGVILPVPCRCVSSCFPSCLCVSLDWCSSAAALPLLCRCSCLSPFMVPPRAAKLEWVLLYCLALDRIFGAR